MTNEEILAKLRCRCCGKIGGYQDNLKRLLLAARNLLTLVPDLNINCGYRCPAHNASEEVGGNPASKHLLCAAMDCWCPAVKPESLARLAVKAGFNGAGIYLSQGGFIHASLYEGPGVWWQEV